MWCDSFSVLDGEHAFDQDFQILVYRYVLWESKYGVIDEADQFGNRALLVWAHPV